MNYTSFFPAIKNQGVCLSCWVSLMKIPFFWVQIEFLSRHLQPLVSSSISCGKWAKSGISPSKIWLTAVMQTSGARAAGRRTLSSNFLKQNENQEVSKLFLLDTSKTKAFPTAPSTLTPEKDKTARKRSKSTNRSWKSRTFVRFFWTATKKRWSG